MDGKSETADCSDAITFTVWKPPRYVIDRRQMEFANRVIPKERFVEYEPADLDWMIPLGMAPEVVIDLAVMQRAAKIVREKVEQDCMQPSWRGGLWIPGQE